MRVSSSGRMRACFVVFPMNVIEVPLTYQFKLTSSTKLRSLCPQIPATATQKLPGFSLNAQLNLRDRLHGCGFQSTRFHDLETASKTIRFQRVYTESIQPLNPTVYV